MSGKKINVDKAAQKELNRIDASARTRIVQGIAGLIQEPPAGDIKPLKGELNGYNRLRVGNWRITYEVTDETVNILEISPRGGAYR